MVAHYFRQIVESMERRNFDRLLSQVRPGAELRLFELGDFRGPEGWKAALSDWMETFPESVLRLDEFINAGGKDVVLITDNRVTGTQSGVSAEGTTAFVLTIEEGMATRGRYFMSKAEALEAAGLSVSQK